MKKEFLKKGLVIIMTVAMTAGLAACENSASNTNDSAQSGTSGSNVAGSSEVDSSAQESEPTGGGHKIGAIFYSKDDSLGATVYSYLNNAAKVLDVDLEWAIGSLDSTGQLADAENLISSGCEGIIFIPLDETVDQLIASLCEENGVYFSIMFRDILNEDIKSAVEANPYYASNCHEDEKTAANDMAHLLADSGRSKFGCVRLDPNVAIAIRNTGFDEGVKETETSIIAEYQTDANAQTHINGITNFVNLYPDMDGILIGSASNGAGETVVTTLEGLTTPDKIKMATFDMYNGIAEDFADGWYVAAAGGMAPDSLFSFLALYNAVDGTPLSDSVVLLSQKEIIVTSADECELYQKYIDNPDYMIYTEEQIKSLVGRYNSDVTVEDFKNLMDKFSITWVNENAHE